MNMLQLRAARPRTAGAFYPRLASHGPIRVRHAVPATLLPHDAPVRREVPLRAQWFRNAITGKLECRWVPDAGTEPHQHRAVAHVRSFVRKPRRVNRADMRPPSRNACPA
jgi:hypothetical protein